MEAEVLLEEKGTAGVITLNRPKAINSLNHPMVTTLTNALRAWEKDDGVHAVLLSGTGERGLCAGGEAEGKGGGGKVFLHFMFLSLIIVL